MSTRVSDKDAETKRQKETIARIEEALRDGFGPPWDKVSGGAIMEAARRAVDDGWVRAEVTFRTRYFRATQNGLEPDWSLWKAPAYQRAERRGLAPMPTILSEAFRPKGRPLKICVMGDAHDDPRLEDKSRFKWLGLWCKDERPDVIIQVGDWATFDSMSRHHQPGTLDQINSPSWQADLDSLGTSMSAFEAGLSGYKPKRKVFLEGNHELRAAAYENNRPEMAGTLTQQWRSIFRGAKWRIVDFGVYHFENGVGFIHYPVNGAGRAYGGKTGNQRAGNDAVFSIVHGHDHKSEVTSSAKIGPTRPIEMVSAGCVLPWGHVEDYAKLATTGWFWGPMVISVLDGQIIDLARVSILTLEDRYAESPPSRK